MIKLNVGGVRFITSKLTIEKDPCSMLARMFAEDSVFTNPKDEEGYTFIDRDGRRFHHVLNYLRSGYVPAFEEKWRYDEILEEADFFALEDLKEYVSKRMEELSNKKRWEGSSTRPCTIIFTPDSNNPPALVQSLSSSSNTTSDGRIQLTGHFTLDEDF
ncbi:unnamed protein product [Heterosigma akashiwo]